MPWSCVTIDIPETPSKRRRGPKDTTRSRACVVLYRGRRLPQNMSRANDTGFCRVLLKENGSALRYAHKLPDCYNPCVRAPGGTFWCRLRIPPAALFLVFRGSASNRYNNLWQLHNIDSVRLVQRVSSSCKKTHILNEKLTCIHANEHVFASVRNSISCNAYIHKTYFNGYW